jgi:hypothetical protein
MEYQYFSLFRKIWTVKKKELIPVQKDVDCFTTDVAAKIFTDDPAGVGSVITSVLCKQTIMACEM